MLIGIDASRAFASQRTGIEEYSYQVIKHLMDKLEKHQVVLYIKESQKSQPKADPPMAEKVKSQKCNSKIKSNDLLENNSGMLEISDTWKVKVIKFPYLWTQIGLSLELLFHPVDALFIPAHVVPIVHSKNTIVTIHGLEYEFCPRAYSFWAKIYMRWAIKRSCKVAKKIIAVSENTKKDLMKLYKIPNEKIKVIYEGVNFLESSSPLGGGCPIGQEREDIFNVQKNEQFSEVRSLIHSSGTFSLREKGINISKSYLLFIGRLEERKNIIGIVKAFEILKEKYKISHKLFLAGGKGHNYKKIITYISNSPYKSDIILSGFINEEEKWQLLSSADVFLFPTFYEGFGLPILEAQSVGVPVVASDNSSIPEIVTMKNSTSPFGRGRSMYSSAGEGTGEQDFYSALLVNPNNAYEIAEATHKLISDKALRDDIIKKGYENAVRFSWEKCAESVVKMLNI